MWENRWMKFWRRQKDRSARYRNGRCQTWFVARRPFPKRIKFNAPHHPSLTPHLNRLYQFHLPLLTHTPIDLQFLTPPTQMDVSAEAPKEVSKRAAEKAKKKAEKAAKKAEHKVEAVLRPKSEKTPQTDAPPTSVFDEGWLKRVYSEKPVVPVSIP
jgi:hypothetical protein